MKYYLMTNLQLLKNGSTDTKIWARRNMPHNKNCSLVYRWTHTRNTAKFTFPCTDQHPHQSCMHKPKKKSTVEHRTGNQFGALLAWANTFTRLHTWAGTAQLCTRQSNWAQISPFQSSVSLTSFFPHFIMFSGSYFPSVMLPVFLFGGLLSHQFI